MKNIFDSEIYSNARYERKFIVDNTPKIDLKELLYSNPACFKRKFKTRKIHNIYFDTLGFDSFYDNIEGEKNRLKVRVRWYESLSNQNTEKQFLEVKVKKDQLGIKFIYPILNKINFKEKNCMVKLKDFILNLDIEKPLKQYILNLKPTLVNTYTRSYYESFDQKFRITVDKNIQFLKFSSYLNSFVKPIYKKNQLVIELKYHLKYENEAQNITQYFPFRLTKYSKYVEGIKHTHLTNDYDSF